MHTTYSDVTSLIGNTPLVELNQIHQHFQLKARILAKVESANPGGSVKDRVAKFMIDDAERTGRLRPGSVIIEPTSGNTGIGLALVAAARGYRIILTMPDTMSAERRTLLSAYGAELVLTDGSNGMKGSIERACLLADEIEGACVLGQFSNPANPAAHEATTGPEIWRDCDGNIDIFVAGVGTGGTISGAGAFLRKQNPQLFIVAVEPSGSPILSGGKAGPHKIQGIGAGFIPKTLNTAIYDSVITVDNEEAFASSRLLATKEGLFTGISSGAALAAAIRLAQDEAHAGKTIVTVLPDSGDRYLSMFTSR
jgi:cysteine synthase A